MLFQELTNFQILYGIFSVIFVVIAVIIGFQILLKYLTLKKKELITVGLALIFLTSAWWGSAFSFLSYVIVGYELSEFQFFLLGDAFIPIALICWMYSFLILVYPHKLKKVLPFYVIISVVYEIILIYFLFTDPSQIATIEGRFNSDHKLFALSFLAFAILSVLITGILFARESLKSEDPKIRLKGKFILVGIISFCFGAIFDAGIPMNSITLVLIRLLLISSAIEYYFGFLIPDRIADILTRSKQ
ncbi:MAG: conserved membrane protein of unknown function [Promethearchaeota archaeon]|nr:MAG: conserved membrane protein of unknown function [Candidatus Lokiarchaeota archaeon]